VSDKKADWKHIVSESLASDPEAQEEYERLLPRYRFIAAMVNARAERGWTQRDLAAATGTPQSSIARLESGDVDPRLETITSICEALQIPLTIGQETVVEHPHPKKRRSA